MQHPKERRADWLRLQGKEGSAILQMLVNFKKDGPKRWRSDGYVEKKRILLDEAWLKFERRHKLISKEELYAEAPYIVKGCFDLVRHAYDEFSQKMAQVEQGLLMEVQGTAADPKLETVQENMLVDPEPNSDANTTLMELAEEKELEDEIETKQKARLVAFNTLNEFMDIYPADVDVHPDEFSFIISHGRTCLDIFTTAHAEFTTNVNLLESIIIQSKFARFLNRFDANVSRPQAPSTENSSGVEQWPLFLPRPLCLHSRCLPPLPPKEPT